MTRLPRLLSAIALGITPLASWAALAPSNSPWRFAMAPQYRTDRSYHKVVVPLTAFLQKALHHSLQDQAFNQSWFAYAYRIKTPHFAVTWDGPQFVAWRDAYAGYHPVVRLNHNLTFVLISRAGSHVKTVHDIDGETVCATNMPNLATLVISQKTSVVNRPYIVIKQGPQEDIQGLLAHQCVATAVPEDFLTKAVAKRVNLIAISRTYPGMTLSVGPMVTASARAHLRAALLSPSGERLAQRLFQGRFIAAHAITYQPYINMLATSSIFNNLLGTHDPAFSQPHDKAS